MALFFFITWLSCVLLSSTCSTTPASTPRTRERALGIPPELLAPARTPRSLARRPARLGPAVPAVRALGFDGPRPLVYYVHGGPQSQERPDFAWFSMPLIQFLTLDGFAVFVPNARGSRAMA